MANGKNDLKYHIDCGWKHAHVHLKSCSAACMAFIYLFSRVIHISCRANKRWKQHCRIHSTDWPGNEQSKHDENGGVSFMAEKSKRMFEIYQDTMIVDNQSGIQL